MASAAGKKPEERRVFICYPRSALRDVGSFHDALKERLQNLHRDYKIFRDKGRDEGENIVPGSEWKKRLHQTLDDSRCCLIVLVPAIFESGECADEVDYFQNKLEKDDRRFFYPIVFIPLTGDESIETQAKSGNRIATAIKDLHHDEFLLSWTNSATSGYQARVNEIANAIHRQFSTKVQGKTAGLVGLGVGCEVGTTKEEEGWTFNRRALGLAVSLAICVVLFFFWLFPRPVPEPVFTTVSTPIELVFSTPSFAGPNRDAAKLDPLGPMILEAGKNGVISIGEGQADGRAWYVIEFANGEKHYIPKDNVPEWETADRDLEIIRPIKSSRAAPERRGRGSNSSARRLYAAQAIWRGSPWAGKRGDLVSCPAERRRRRFLPGKREPQ